MLRPINVFFYAILALNRVILITAANCGDLRRNEKADYL